jgi:hypothetical protein
MTSRVSSRYSINKRGVEQHAKLNQFQAITQIKEISIMSNLFTAVSAEQQEIVAGGSITLDELAATTFSEEILLFDTNLSSNGNGSTVDQFVFASDVFTDAFKDVNIHI